MTKLQRKVATLQIKADELAEQLLALMDDLPMRDPERKTLTPEYSYEDAVKVLTPIVDRVGKLGASQEYWDSPEGKAVKRDCATLRRALAICQANGPGLVGRSGKQPVTKAQAIAHDASVLAKRGYKII